MADDPIDDLRSDPLNERERQETRYTNGKVLREMVDPAIIQKMTEQHDLLWWALGWLPSTVKNWKAIAIVLAGSAFIGGQEFIANVTQWLGGQIK